MPENSIEKLLDDPNHLPDILIPDNDALRMLVNCYQLCDSLFPELTNAVRVTARLSQLHQNLRNEFIALLFENHEARRPTRMKNKAISRLRKRLVAKSRQRRKETLTRCAALLYALSVYIADVWEAARFPEPPTMKTSAVLGGLDILITRWRESSIARLVEQPPRSEQEMSDMLINYHPTLRLTPVSVGGCNLVHVHLPLTTAELLESRANEKRIKIAVSPLSLDAGLRCRILPGFPENEPSRFVVESVGEERKQIEFLRNILQQCHDEGVSILALPELRMPPNLLQTVKDFLRNQSLSNLKSGKGLLLVAAGSWHIELEEGWVNRCQVLDCAGEMIWEHDKLAEYNITAENIRENPSIQRQTGINDHGGTEAIIRGSKLEFADCALGRISVAICAGFLHPSLEPVLKASGANIFLIPTMTPDIRPVEERARTLIRSQRAATFAANCGTVAGRDESGKISNKASCFYLLPKAGAKPRRLKCPSVTGNHLHIFTLNRSLTSG